MAQKFFDFRARIKKSAILAIFENPEKLGKDYLRAYCPNIYTVGKVLAKINRIQKSRQGQKKIICQKTTMKKVKVKLMRIWTRNVSHFVLGMRPIHKLRHLE